MGYTTVFVSAFPRTGEVNYRYLTLKLNDTDLHRIIGTMPHKYW